MRRGIEAAWEAYGHLYESRDGFERFPYVEQSWRLASPSWWGLNDIVGFIDIRANLLEQALQATLFLTTKRVSRTLVDKTYVAGGQEVVRFGEVASNDELRRDLIQAVERLATDTRLRRRQLDLQAWRQVVNHTDLVGILREEARRLLASE